MIVPEPDVVSEVIETAVPEVLLMSIGPAVVSAEEPTKEPAGRPLVSSHRRALSDRFLRRGVDETATGSILDYNAP